MLLYTLHKREVDRSRKPINRGKEKPESKPNNIHVNGNTQVNTLPELGNCN